jgi:tetratricopeptide (TPR) repeat protein
MTDSRSLFGQAQARRRRAEELGESGSREEACEAYRQAGSLYEKAGEFSLAGSMMSMLSHHLRDLGRANEAFEALERSAVMHRNNPDKWEAARGLRQVASGFMVWGARDRYKALDKEAQRLQDRARSGKTKGADPGERIHALHEYALSRGHGWHGSRQARKALKEALRIDTEADAGRRESIVSALALIEDSAGNPERARAHYQEVIDLSAQNGDRGGLARNLLALGQLELHAGRYDEAEPPLLRAIEIARTEGGRETFLLGQMGQLEQYRGNWEESRAWYREKLQAARNDRDADSEILALRCWAETEAKAGDLERGRELLREACRVEEAAGHWHGHVHVLRDFGDMERDAGNIEAARGQYETALGMLDDHEDWQAQALFNERLGRLALDNDPAAARGYFGQASRCYGVLGHATLRRRARIMSWLAAVSAWLRRRS